VGIGEVTLKGSGYVSKATPYVHKVLSNSAGPNMGGCKSGLTGLVMCRLDQNQVHRLSDRLPRSVICSPAFVLTLEL